MKKIVVVGGGNIGGVISALLRGAGDYDVKLIDRAARVVEIASSVGVAAEIVDASDGEALRKSLSGAYALISAAPFHLTTKIADAAADCGVHYLDLTEDVASTRYVHKLAQSASNAFIPQCGLAPGFVSIVAHDLAQRFDEVFDLRLRVGALPLCPSNALGYNLTWSTDGVINEYCEPCEAIVDGVLRETTPLEEVESLAIDGVAYEAFNTSGGLGSLCQTLAGKVRNLNYKTVRYPGHASLMKVLLNDLRLRERRELLHDVLEAALPYTHQDVVVIFVTASGVAGGVLRQETYANKVHAREIAGTWRTAIQVTTAAGVCAVLDMLARNELPQRGVVRMEDISLAGFLRSRFGNLYKQSSASAHAI